MDRGKFKTWWEQDKKYKPKKWFPRQMCKNTTGSRRLWKGINNNKETVPKYKREQRYFILLIAISKQDRCGFIYYHYYICFCLFNFWFSFPLAITGGIKYK